MKPNIFLIFGLPVLAITAGGWFIGANHMRLPGNRAALSVKASSAPHEPQAHASWELHQGTSSQSEGGATSANDTPFVQETENVGESPHDANETTFSAQRDSRREFGPSGEEAASANVIPRVDADALNVPQGVKLPAAFRDERPLPPPQRRALDRIANRFIDEVSLSADATLWDAARERADRDYIRLFGIAVHNAMELQAAKDALRERRADSSPARTSW